MDPGTTGQAARGGHCDNDHMTTPRCTYRIQLTDEFTLKDTVGVLDYLDDLERKTGPA